MTGWFDSDFFLGGGVWGGGVGGKCVCVAALWEGGPPLEQPPAALNSYICTVSVTGWFDSEVFFFVCVCVCVCVCVLGGGEGLGGGIMSPCSRSMGRRAASGTTTGSTEWLHIYSQCYWLVRF